LIERVSVRKIFGLCLILCVFLASCGAKPAASAAVFPAGYYDTPTASPLPKMTDTPIATASLPAATATSPLPTATNEPARDPENWENWPVIPEAVSAELKTLYRQGITAGNDPHRFSKIGDCQNVESYFLSHLDKNDYSLPEGQEYLQETIEWYAGSWKRDSYAVRGGLNAAAALTSYWLGDACDPEKYNNPIACELGEYKPAVALISFEENWDGNVEKYDKYTRKIIDYVLEQKIVPILAFSANNATLNAHLAVIAVDYNLPVWNLWKAVYPLPDHGLADGFHLTHDKALKNYNFADGVQSGWEARNLTALQAIDAVRKMLSED